MRFFCEIFYSVTIYVFSLFLVSEFGNSCVEQLDLFGLDRRYISGQLAAAAVNAASKFGNETKKPGLDLVDYEAKYKLCIG